MDQAVHEYEDLETVAREEIMASGGSLSHHHGNLSSWLFVSTSVFPSRFDSFFVGNERCGWKPQQLARGLFFSQRSNRCGTVQVRGPGVRKKTGIFLRKTQTSSQTGGVAFWSFFLKRSQLEGFESDIEGHFKGKDQGRGQTNRASRAQICQGYSKMRYEGFFKSSANPRANSMENSRADSSATKRRQDRLSRSSLAPKSTLGDLIRSLLRVNPRAWGKCDLDIEGRFKGKDQGREQTIRASRVRTCQWDSEMRFEGLFKLRANPRAKGWVVGQKTPSTSFKSQLVGPEIHIGDFLRQLWRGKSKGLGQMRPKNNFHHQDTKTRSVVLILKITTNYYLKINWKVI